MSKKINETDQMALEAMLFFKELDFSQYTDETIQPLLEPYRQVQITNYRWHPLMIYAAYHQIFDLKMRYEAGDKYALPLAVRIVAMHDVLMPDWLQKEFVQRFRDVNHYKVKDWSDIFGRTIPKGKSFHTLKRDRELLWLVGGDIREAKKQGKSINTELFEELAAKHGTNRDKIAKLYKKLRNLINLKF